MSGEQFKVEVIRLSQLRAVVPPDLQPRIYHYHPNQTPFEVIDKDPKKKEFIDKIFLIDGKHYVRCQFGKVFMNEDINLLVAITTCGVLQCSNVDIKCSFLLKSEGHDSLLNPKHVPRYANWISNHTIVNSANPNQTVYFFLHHKVVKNTDHILTFDIDYKIRDNSHPGFVYQDRNMVKRFTFGPKVPLEHTIMHSESGSLHTLQITLTNAFNNLECDINELKFQPSPELALLNQYPNVKKMQKNEVFGY